MTSDQTMQTFCEHIRQRRLVLDLTQPLVAKRAGIGLSTLRDIERGRGSTKLENVFKVLEVLGIDETVAASNDPLKTDLGVARAHRIARQRAGRS